MRNKILLIGLLIVGVFIVGASPVNAGFLQDFWQGLFGLEQPLEEQTLDAVNDDGSLEAPLGLVKEGLVKESDESDESLEVPFDVLVEEEPLGPSEARIEREKIERDRGFTQTLQVGETISGITLVGVNSEDTGIDSCRIEYNGIFYTIAYGEREIMSDGTVIGVTDVITTSASLPDYCELTIVGTTSQGIAQGSSATSPQSVVIITNVGGSGGGSGGGSSIDGSVSHSKRPTTIIHDFEIEKEIEDIEIEMDEEEIIKINKISEKVSEIKENGFSIYTTKGVKVIEHKLFLETDNGERELKVMPKKLKDKIKNIERVELKVIKEEPVYVVEHKEDYKLFGILAVKPTITTQVSAEDEEILKTEKPLWLFLAKKQ